MVTRHARLLHCILPQSLRGWPTMALQLSVLVATVHLEAAGK